MCPIRLCGGKPNFWNGDSGDPLGVVGMLGLSHVCVCKVVVV